jgi:hypothetical protein
VRGKVRQSGAENTEEVVHPPPYRAGVAAVDVDSDGGFVTDDCDGMNIPGQPWRNGYIESFNSRVRDACPNINMFWSLAQARVVISDWRWTPTTASDTPRSATRRQLSTLQSAPIHDRLSLTSAPMSRASVGCILRAPGRPVDLERDALGEGSRFHQVKRDVRAVVRK